MKLSILIGLCLNTSILVAQSNLIVSYIHPLANGQINQEVNVSQADQLLISNSLKHTVIGFDACYKKRIRFSLEWFVASIDYQYTLMIPNKYRLNEVDKSRVFKFYSNFRTFRFSSSFKFYRDRRFSSWLGLSVSIYPHSFINNNNFFTEYLFSSYTGREFKVGNLSISTSGPQRLWIPSIIARHIITFPRREFVFTTGVQIIPRQKLNVEYTYSTPTSTSTQQVEEIIRPSALLFVNFSLYRKIKFRYGDGRLRRILGINQANPENSEDE